MYSDDAEKHNMQKPPFYQQLFTSTGTKSLPVHICCCGALTGLGECIRKELFIKRLMNVLPKNMQTSAAKKIQVNKACSLLAFPNEISGQ